MKREALGKTKLQRLCRKLKIQRWMAVGLLESLWHITAKDADDGGIGRLSNEEIAIAIDYLGDENELVDALVGSGWIDTHPTCRLVVHDWSEHADTFVHRRLERQGRLFADGCAPFDRTKKRESGSSPRSTKTAICHTMVVQRHEKEGFGQPNGSSHARAVPVPVPVPVPVSGVGRPTVAQTPGVGNAPDLSDIAKSIYSRHPKDRRCTLQAAERALAQIAMDSSDPPLTIAERIDDRHAGWVASEEWTKDRGKWVPKLLNWLDPVNGGWDADPPEAKEERTVFDELLAEIDERERGVQ